MNGNEVRELSDGELAVKELELREALFRLRLRRGVNQLDSPALLKQTRRDLARVRTVQCERVNSKKVRQES